MFDRVIPNRLVINNLNPPLTEGERTLLDFLDNNLKRDQNFHEDSLIENYDGWLIFVQLYLNGSRPDIIIFNPNVGIQIFEVKDWNLENYSFRQNDNIGKAKKKPIFCFTDSNGTYPIKSPKEQVEHYRDKLTGVLVPRIGELIDENKKNFALVKTALYFHKSDTNKAQELFKVEINNFSYFPCIGKDILKKENLNQIVPYWYINKSKYWLKEWNKEILFWLTPPFHSLEQTTVLALTEKQKEIAEPKSGHHRIRGVAGSGKTQVLAYRAAKLASEGKKVLILTFNITLWHFINDMIKRSPFKFEWKNITRNHFHGFCIDILNEFGERWPNDEGNIEEIFKSVVPNKIVELIKGKNIMKYDAILIDEGQDYYIEWYQMLCHFLTSNDEVLVVCDNKQNIYGRQTEWLNKTKKGTEKFGKWHELKKIIRLPENVAITAKDFSDKFNLNQDVKLENIRKSDLFNQYNDHLLWWNIDEKMWLMKIVEAFKIIQEHGDSKHPSDFVILLPDKKYGCNCAKHFKEIEKKEVNHIFETTDDSKGRRKKMAFWMGDGRLKMSSIHSFKGWESQNVILYIPKNIIGNIKLFDMLVYTAITRTRQNIIIINSSERYKEFGKNKQKEWL